MLRTVYKVLHRIGAMFACLTDSKNNTNNVSPVMPAAGNGERHVCFHN